MLTIDRRLLPGEDGASALADLERVLAAPLGVPGATVSASLLMEMPAMETPAGHPARRDRGRDGSLQHPGRRAGGAGPVPATAASSTAISASPSSCSDPARCAAHRPDETCPVAEIESVARAYAYLAGRVLAGAPTA